MNKETILNTLIKLRDHLLNCPENTTWGFWLCNRVFDLDIPIIYKFETRDYIRQHKPNKDFLSEMMEHESWVNTDSWWKVWEKEQRILFLDKLIQDLKEEIK